MSGATILTPEQASRRDAFVTACEILTHRDPALVRAALIEGDVLAAGEWRGFWDRPLAWALANSRATGDARRLDLFWLLVEEQHALLAAQAAAPPPPA